MQHMLDNGIVPTNTYTSPHQYVLPKSLLESWRQLRRQSGLGFKDVALVKLCSGDGGDGKVSYFRAAGLAVGPPDGGTGGQGGGVYVQASENVSSLRHLRHIYKAQKGKSGGSAQLTGARGENIVLLVPVGTRIYFSPSNEELRKQEPGTDFVTNVDVINNIANHRRFKGRAIQLSRPSFNDGTGGWTFKHNDEKEWLEDPNFKEIVHRVKKYDMINRREEYNQDIFPLNGYDLDTPGAPICLLTGGVGGLGNMHFQTATLRSPSMAKKGRSGAEISVFVELKMLADVGLVGMPNAGKSTLVHAISRARPKIGDYEFTTLVPNIATVNVSADGRQLRIADIPGIIKGAAQNKGMGLGFLRHVERCQCIALIIPLDKLDPVADVELLLNEIGQTSIKGKPVVVIATKADLEDTESKYNVLKAYADERGWSIVPCSALEHHVDGVVQALADMVFKEQKRQESETINGLCPQ